MAALLALAMIAASCSSSKGKGATGSTTGSTSGSTTTLAPKTGGTLTFGQWAEPASLDPFAVSGYGTSGGIELGAIYDRLVEWNPQTKKYDMKIAESLTANATNTEWTMKIRPNVHFSDGTILDANAVKVNFDRQKTTNANVRGALTVVSGDEVVDPLTIKFTLSQPWGGFPVVFNNDVGMIVSPAAMDRLGKTGLQTNAVGAGPFVLDSYKPGESLTLKRNPTYWNGPVYLDAIKFIHAGSGDQTLTYLMSGAIQAGYLRDPIPIGKAKDAKLGNSAVVVDSGEMLLVNNGVAVTCAGGAPAALCAGKADGTKVPTKTPGSDPKVRQALAAALDTKALNDRVDQGKATPATGLFDPTFPWNPDVALPGYDLDKAKQLVSEAKAAGWEGKIRFSCGVEDQTRATEALTVEAMLKGAGIDVDTTRANVTVNESVADVITKKDYDLACWGLQMSPDDSAPTQIDQFLRSTSASNRTGYSNPAMDTALTELQAAGTDQARTTAYKKVALLWSSDVPSVPIFHLSQGVFWNSNVKGMKGTGLTNVVLDKVWGNS